MAGRPRKRPRPSRDAPAELYEAEEVTAAEDRQAGQRYDRVDNYEYELPSDFEDEEIDEEAAFNDADKKLYGDWFGDRVATDAGDERDGGGGLLASSDEDDVDEYDPDDFSEEEASDQEGPEQVERHQRMLQDVVGTVPKPRRQETVITEALPESEYNLPPPADSAGGGELRISDLIAGLGPEARRLGAARRTLEKLDKQTKPVQPPLPGPVRRRKQRQAGYEEAAKDVTKWQPLVKAHREAPTTVYVPGRGEVARVSSTAALAVQHAPTTTMETEVAALLAAAGATSEAAVQEAENNLAVKALSVEEARARREELAKMRSLLFHHEAKLKHLKKIKSKDYHRRALRTARAKAAKAGGAGEEEEEAAILRAAAEEAELRRARERLTLKHRNTSQWARRALRRGLDVLDDGTRDALQEQLRLGQELRQKPEHGGHESASSEASTEASDEEGSEEEGSKREQGIAGPRTSKARERLKAAAADVLTGDGGAGKGPATGLFALPFMQRGMERRQAEAKAEATALLQELEREGEQDSADEVGADGKQSWAEDDDEDSAPASGRRTFGLGPTSMAGVADIQGSEEGSEGHLSGDDEDIEGRKERLGQVAGTAFKLPTLQKMTASQVAAGPSRQSPSQPRRSKARQASATGADTNGHSDVALPTAPVGTCHLGSGVPNHEIGNEAVAVSGTAPNTQQVGAISTLNSEDSAPGAFASSMQRRVAVARRNALLNPKPVDTSTVARKMDSSGSVQHAGASAQDNIVISVGPAPDPSMSAAGMDLTTGKTTGASFVAANTFQGHRHNYAFKNGPKGMGYYQDSLAVPASDLGTGHSPEGVAKENSIEGEQGGRMVVHGGDSDMLMKPNLGGRAAQRELIARAFAGDDVVADFEAVKAAEAAAEAPANDAPSLLPGWGAWTAQQRTPAWIEAAQAKAQRKREAALAARKDARMHGVVISEKWDKRGAKYSAAGVPFPYDSKVTYERARRQPLGPDFNTASAHRDMTRPSVIKAAGAPIAPLKYSQPVAKMAAQQPSDNARRKAIVRIEGGMPRPSKK